MMRKKPFTLVEIMISFMLMAFIVSAIYSVYAAMSVGTLSVEKSIQRQRRLLTNSRTIRHYLTSIISPLHMFSGKGAAPPFFFTEGTNGTRGFQVYTCLDNGIDPTAALSNEVLGRFYIDEKGRFMLTLASHPVRAEIFHRYETDITLCENVEAVFWDFSSWPDKAIKRQKEANSIDVAPLGVWCTEWKREWMYTPPGIVRLTISFLQQGTHKQEEMVITAVQPTSIQPLKFEGL